MKANSIVHGQILIGKAPQDCGGLLLLAVTDGRHAQRRHILDHREKLKCASAVVPTKKPRMALSDD
jgi:hypothetical protein